MFNWGNDYSKQEDETASSSAPSVNMKSRRPTDVEVGIPIPDGQGDLSVIDA
jgi:hypothetical protein